MADLLIRGVPPDVVAAIDAKARRAGLSRSEFVRRLLGREVPAEEREVVPSSFTRLALLSADLEDPEVMGDAWS